MSHLGDDDFRAAAAFTKAFFVSDGDGQRAITRNVDHTRLVHAITAVAAAIPVDRNDPVGWADRLFDRIGDIALVSARPRPHRSPMRRSPQSCTHRRRPPPLMTHH